MVSRFSFRFLCPSVSAETHRHTSQMLLFQKAIEFIGVIKIF